MDTDTLKTYTNPAEVVSPTDSWTLERVLYDGGAGSWSAAEGIWGTRRSLALRWNGGPPPERPLGNPQSRGRPTWFILPADLEPEMRRAIARQSAAKTGGTPSLKEELLAIGRRCAALPDHDSRPADKILGYDDSGLPS